MQGEGVGKGKTNDENASSPSGFGHIGGIFGGVGGPEGPRGIIGFGGGFSRGLDVR